MAIIRRDNDYYLRRYDPFRELEDLQRRMFSDTAPEITAAFQPNACCSGTISTPGVCTFGIE